MSVFRAAEGIDEDLELLADVHDDQVVAQVEPRTWRRHAGYGALVTTMLVVGTCAASLSAHPSKPVQAGALISLADAETESHVRYSYGLEEAPCPEHTNDKSESAKVTLQAIKDMIGAEEDDEVEFWWVYPVVGANVSEASLEDWSAKTQIKYHGGYLYKWGHNTKCVALVPKGEDLTMAPASEFPKGKMDWHKPAGKTDKTQFAWIPPTKKGSSCEHGCFIYKSKDGKKTALKVLLDADA